MGLYSSDVQQLGRLGNDAWRACRLVLDTGMHGMGWSRDKAIEHFKKKGELYKAELIESIPKGEEVSIYFHGEWHDLCLSLIHI